VPKTERPRIQRREHSIIWGSINSGPAMVSRHDQIGMARSGRIQKTTMTTFPLRLGRSPDATNLQRLMLVQEVTVKMDRSEFPTLISIAEPLSQLRFCNR